MVEYTNHKCYIKANTMQGQYEKKNVSNAEFGVYSQWSTDISIPRKSRCCSA